MLDGYCWPQSVLPGGEVALHVSSSGPFGVEVAREGGAREVVWRADAVAGSEHPVPATASADGCDWPASLAVPTDEAWRSGHYSVRLTSGDQEAHAFFAVRPAAGLAPILLVLSTSTANAYNDWGAPRSTRAARLLRAPAGPGLPREAGAGGPKAQGVPDREALGYFRWAEEHDLSPWSGGAGWWTWERSFVEWAEREGFASTSRSPRTSRSTPRSWRGTGSSSPWATTSTGPGGCATPSRRSCPRRQRRVLQREHVLVAGAFRGRDDGLFQVPSRRRPVAGSDEQRFLTGSWSDRRIGRSEASMTGLSFSRGGYLGTGRAFHVRAAPTRSGDPIIGRSPGRTFATGTRSAWPMPSSGTRSMDAT